ncbi:MAG: hypothetical protein CSA79_02310 [Thiothrix nivea]|nr:MAG: hypothetical protein CSA79_02310 [Thiothrix nivea]
MSIDNKNNKWLQPDAFDHAPEEQHYPELNRDNPPRPPHITRRNIEDYLAEQALKKRLIDIFDDDFLLD